MIKTPISLPIALAAILLSCNPCEELQDKSDQQASKIDSLNHEVSLLAKDLKRQKQIAQKALEYMLENCALDSSFLITQDEIQYEFLD